MQLTILSLCLTEIGKYIWIIIKKVGVRKGWSKIGQTWQFHFIKELVLLHKMPG